MNINYFYLVLVTILLTSAQTVWKYAFTKIGEIQLSISGLQKVFNPFVLMGIVLYIIATFFWFKVLHNLPLSIAYPTLAISYVFGYFIGILFFKEQFYLTSFLGVILIFCGVTLLSFKL